MEERRSINSNELVNGGVKMEFIMPLYDAGNIDSVVGQNINIESEGFIFVGVLKKTQTIQKRDEQYKKLVVMVESVYAGEHAIMFPDKKDEYPYPVSIVY